MNIVFLVLESRVNVRCDFRGIHRLLLAFLRKISTRMNLLPAPNGLRLILRDITFIRNLKPPDVLAGISPTIIQSKDYTRPTLETIASFMRWDPPRLCQVEQWNESLDIDSVYNLGDFRIPFEVLFRGVADCKLFLFDNLALCVAAARFVDVRFCQLWTFERMNEYLLEDLTSTKD
jgi:hypothetical protein